MVFLPCLVHDAIRQAEIFNLPSTILSPGKSISEIVSYKNQGPVVQSIVSLTKSLVSDSLSLLARLKSSVLIFFAEKM